MKFDNFAKYAGGDGAILTAPDDEKWLFFAGVGMKIPEYKNVCGKQLKMPDYIDVLINFSEYEPCELTGAHVPRPDSKPNELLRTFGSRNNYMDISNKAFGFIEKKDRTYLSSCKSSTEEGQIEKYKALLVTDDYNEDEPEIKMIIISKEKKDNE